MATKQKKERKAKGRTPTLAPYVDSPFKIYMTTGGKEYDAQVLSSGIIKIGEKEFTSPSSAGQHILGKNDKGKPLQVDGWKCWRFNKKTGENTSERVELNVLRGAKSPLKVVEPKPKTEKAAKPRKAKPRKAKAAKANGAAKLKADKAPKADRPKRIRKPRTWKRANTKNYIGEQSSSQIPGDPAPAAQDEAQEAAGS